MLFGLLGSQQKYTSIMADDCLIKRYAGYYAGWCIAFGEHKSSYDEGREISWLYGESKVGLIISSKANQASLEEVLGQPDKMPEITLSDTRVTFNHLSFPLNEEDRFSGFQWLKDLISESTDLHVYLTSHFCYPKGTKIITFDSKKPPAIIYKEIDPMKVIWR